MEKLPTDKLAEINIDNIVPPAVLFHSDQFILESGTEWKTLSCSVAVVVQHSMRFYGV